MQTEENKHDEVSFKDIVYKCKLAVKYVSTSWKVIILCAIIFGLFGLGYSFYKKPVYLASSTFVLDGGGKGGALSQYSGLASLAGIDLGGSSGGIFQEDNIIELYKSRIMIERTLLSPITINGKNILLIDRYINYNKLRDKWKKSGVSDSISFDSDPAKFNRKQDSIITSIAETFNKTVLSVAKIDKKLSIIKVDVVTTDELFAKEFNIKLVETVNNFYTQTKTKKSLQNLLILQRQADSTRAVLNNSISGVASAIDAAPNANPALSTLRVPSQRKQVDVQANSAIYTEIVKNLEISKISLRQETPLIQLIDEPVLPLTISKVGKVKGFAIGFLLGAILSVIFIVIKKVASNLMS
jgi:hypothetical protein